MIAYICRGCRTLHQAADYLAGATQDCYLCGEKVLVPRQEGARPKPPPFRPTPPCPPRIPVPSTSGR